MPSVLRIIDILAKRNISPPPTKNFSGSFPLFIASWKNAYININGKTKHKKLIPITFNDIELKKAYNADNTKTPIFNSTDISPVLQSIIEI